MTGKKGNCKDCIRQWNCNKTVGMMFGFCNTDYAESTDDLSDSEMLWLKRVYYEQFQNTADADYFKTPEDIPDDVIIEHYKEIVYSL